MSATSTHKPGPAACVRKTCITLVTYNLSHPKLFDLKANTNMSVSYHDETIPHLVSYPSDAMQDIDSDKAMCESVKGGWLWMRN